MRTDCSQDSFEFGTVEGRRVVGAFDGGQITSHAGGCCSDPRIERSAWSSDWRVASRIRKRSNCAALAGKSTLNRLEHAAKVGSDPYHKISYDEAAIAALFVTLCLESYVERPTRMIIDLDATHDPIHGEQEGRHFHGYYDCDCYLPLYVFCGRHLLAAKLRTADKDAADGAREEIARIVAQTRSRWPEVQIILRADSYFARDDLMVWSG
jgi:hypothetical protein